jgi:hypothetical protein
VAKLYSKRKGAEKISIDYEIFASSLRLCDSAVFIKNCLLRQPLFETFSFKFGRGRWGVRCYLFTITFFISDLSPTVTFSI